jgi:NAD(P)H-nitrite reductase large subunit
MLQDGQKGVIIQRDKQTYAVAPHIPCGVIKPQTLRRLADGAEKYAAALKVTGGGKPRLARELVKDLSTEQALQLLERVIQYYKANARPHQRLGSMLDKMDFEDFKNAVLPE